ncbi:MAG: hypothetical protein NTW82_12370 [Bacteroidia bacterium]|nr:hypothetical protein [Bacteroidia bacterium]
MDTTEVILIAAALLALGFSLYRKFVKKDQGKSSYGQKEKPGSAFSLYSKDDDYEPYSKK